MVHHWADSAAEGWDRSVAAIERARALRAHRASARRELVYIGRMLGRTLTAAQRHECRDYARDVLGSRWHAPWLEVYTAVRGRFVEGWIPPSYLSEWIADATTSGLRGVTSVKTLTRRLLRTDALPDLGYVLEGRLYDRDLRPVDEAFFVAALRQEHPYVVLKADRSFRATGFRRVPTDRLLSDDRGTWGNAVIQQWVDPHPLLAEVMPDSVAAYRIFTVTELTGDISSRGAIAKFGRLGHDSTRGDAVILVAVVDEDGTLADEGHTPQWAACRAHPDTGVPLGGRRLPMFAEAVAACLGWHRTFPHLGMIGWDVTVDAADRLRLLEWNSGHVGLYYPEAVIGPLFTGLGWEDLHSSRVR
jgi:hypothetical protein